MFVAIFNTIKYGGQRYFGVDPTDAPDGMTLIETGTVPDWQTQYGDPASKTIKNRPPMGQALDTDTVPADGATAATLSNLPNPTTVVVSGPVKSQAAVTDGTIALTFDTPGMYTVALDSFPHLSAQVTIHAT